MPLPLTRANIVADARSYVGIRWLHEGRSRSGVDCVGLLCCVGKDFGVKFEDMKGYSRIPSGFGFMNHLLKYTTINRTNLPQPGSNAMIRGAERASHVGIFGEIGGRPTLIHANSLAGIVEEKYWQPGVNFALVRVLDYPGVLD